MLSWVFVVEGRVPNFILQWFESILVNYLLNSADNANDVLNVEHRDIFRDNRGDVGHKNSVTFAAKL